MDVSGDGDITKGDVEGKGAGCGGKTLVAKAPMTFPGGAKLTTMNALLYVDKKEDDEDTEMPRPITVDERHTSCVKWPVASPKAGCP